MYKRNMDQIAGIKKSYRNIRCLRVMHSDGSDFEKYNENTKIPVVRGRDRSLKDCCVTAICPPLMAPPGVGNTGVTCDDHEKSRAPP